MEHDVRMSSPAFHLLVPLFIQCTCHSGQIMCTPSKTTYIYIHICLHIYIHIYQCLSSYICIYTHMYLYIRMYEYDTYSSGLSGRQRMSSPCVGTYILWRNSHSVFSVHRCVVFGVCAPYARTSFFCSCLNNRTQFRICSPIRVRIYADIRITARNRPAMCIVCNGIRNSTLSSVDAFARL